MTHPRLDWRGASAIALATLLAGCGGSGETEPPPPAPPSGPVALTCAQLVGLAIPATAIGLPTTGGTVTTATPVDAAGSGAKLVPEHCLVTATIAPVDPAAQPITFRLALPTVWNRKAVMFGGGGFDGTLPNVTGNVPAGPADQTVPIGRGYAVFASNGGHAAGALGSLDGTFLTNEEMLRNWAGEALKKTRDAATYLIKARYAVDKIDKAYFAGGSTGGREALEVGTRWPDDWNGIIAWYPAWKQMSAILAGHRMNRALAKPGAYPSPAKRLLVYNAALAACDAMDGLADGIIANQQRCNAAFDPETATVNGTPLRCPDGVDAGDHCLSDVQIATLKAMNASTRFNFTLASGETGYPGYNVWGADLGITSNPNPLEATVAFLNLATSQPVFPMPATAPYISRQTDAIIRYGITRDIGFDSLSLDPENPGPWGPRISEISTLLDVPVNLDAFAAKGGKLLLAHGTADVLVSSRGTEEYYQRLQARMGPAEVAKFVRFYQAPGYGHAVSTNFNVAWDSLTTLENWAEKGTAPPPQVMADTATGAISRTRPLCDYPNWPRYNGTGDVNAAASFTCVPYEDVPPTQRATHLGTVIGTDQSATSRTYAWKGIPFAKAPVGELRWKAPAEPEAWTTPRFAQSFGNACSSAGRLYGPGQNNQYDATIGSTLGKTVGAEDCLYLNIWRPASAATQLPVIVFVHGGSNITGYTADPVYDGATLARTANAVVVTVNYRLGLLGFFNLGQLKSGNALDDSGNFAILDIIKALQFVNRNVANFGGDPGNVTLMGQSAGAVNVFAVMTSPLVVSAKPALVHKTVPISGAISLASELPAGSIAALARPSDFRGQADYFLAQLVIADGLAADLTAASAYVASKTPAEVAAYLRSKSADTIWQTVVSKLAPIGAGGSGPIPEGTVVPTSPISAIKAGQYVKGPVLLGNTRDEGKLFPTLLPAVGGINGRLINDAAVFSIAFNYKPEGPPTTTVEQWIPASYLPATTPGTGWNAKTEQVNQIFFGIGRDKAAEALLTQQQNVWAYRFDWDQLPAPFDVIYGAAHAFDLPFVFGNFGPSLYANISYTSANQPGRLALSDAMMRSLGAFARSGDPNNAALGVNWPTWPATLRFDATLGAKAITVH
ncbi:tannase/feruloyl esterase family alpha/beta hydrolase [Aquabacterium sp.]|uniref:tannase/feruloyl esterase family alpha/beta hydrolase n=1 Tax=Aquabacterium sp. TaxID=1872578 RepID=UPI00378459B3